MDSTLTIIVVNSQLNNNFSDFGNYFNTMKCVFNDRIKSLCQWPISMILAWPTWPMLHAHPMAHLSLSLLYKLLLISLFKVSVIRASNCVHMVSKHVFHWPTCVSLLVDWPWCHVVIAMMLAHPYCPSLYLYFTAALSMAWTFYPSHNQWPSCCPCLYS